MGIWNDVRIEKVEAVRLSDPLVQSNVTDGLASMTFSVKVEDISSKDISGILRGSVGNIEFAKPVSLKAGEKRQRKRTLSPKRK